MAVENYRILVVVAHPHDFTHCAGTCGIHSKRGDSVTVVCVTGGSRMHNEMLFDELLKPEGERDPKIIGQTLDEFSQIKAKEFRKVCELFGITDIRIFHSPEPFRLRKSPEVVDALRDIILETRPHILITQKPYFEVSQGMVDSSPDDHTETAQAVREAQQIAATPDNTRMIKPHTIAATYYPGVYFMDNEIDFYIDITEWKKRRVEAEKMFRSQCQTDAYCEKRIEIASGHAGWFAGTAYAEGFVRGKADVLPYIIVPEFNLKKASDYHMNNIKRVSGELNESKKIKQD